MVHSGAAQLAIGIVLLKKSYLFFEKFAIHLPLHSYALL